MGLVLGQLAGSNSVTIAKVILFWNNGRYTRDGVAEASLHVIFFLASAGACLGAVAAMRGWIKFEQILTSTAIAGIVALLTIVDYSLPLPEGDVQLPFWEMLYYLGWIIGLWFAPLFVLPGHDGDFLVRVRRGCALLVVAAGMSMAGVVVGGSLELAAERVPDIRRWLEGPSYLSDPQRFWMARPVTVNAICGAYVGVAFASVWWRGLWRSNVSAWMWTTGMSVFAIVYTGIYGAAFYAEGKSGAPWRFFLGFGALPASVALTVVVTYKLTHLKNARDAVGWPVSIWFWRTLPVGLAVIFAVTALHGLAPLADYDGAEDTQRRVLVVAHAVNGVVMGLTLRLLRCTLVVARTAG